MRCMANCRTSRPNRIATDAPRAGKTTRLETRISLQALEIVKRAAEIQGRSVSDFVVAAAQAAARKTIEKTNIIRLSLEDQQRVWNAIINPPEPNEALRKAAATYKRLVRSSSS